MKKKVCFIAQFPPPIHGLSKAVDTLYNSRLQEEFEFEKVDITNNKKFFRNIINIVRSKADLFYFTISQTKGGNLRDLVILKILSLRQKRCIIHLHGGYYRKLVDNDIPLWQRQANYTAISKLDGAIVLSESLKSNFTGMLPENKIFVVANCIDDEYLISDKEFEIKMKKLEEKEVLDVLYLSNFIRSKGYPEVLELAKAEKLRVDAGEKKRLHFNFAGKFFEESERQFFQRYVLENNLDDFITYYGVVEGEGKRELLKKSDIFILLTRYPNEGQPISILEAMGNGMAIVTTRHAGIPDIVRDKENGILLDFDQKLNYINLTNNELIRYSYKNRDLVLREYRQVNYINEIERIFGYQVNREGAK